MLRQPYDKQTVIDVIERRRGGAVPLAFHKWWGEGLEEKYGHDSLENISADIPDDVVTAGFITPGDRQSPTDDPTYCWSYSGTRGSQGTAKDAGGILTDWEELPRYLEEFPDPEKQPGIFEPAKQVVDAHGGRYVLGHWWFCFYERLWAIRGMENVLMDFLLHPEELKALSRAILEHHKKAVRGLAAAGVDGIFVSDDLGAQSALMMSPDVFRTFLKPLYRELIEEIHSCGMHFWLHTCGNVTQIVDDFIEIGLDVIHPIQAGTMDLEEVSAAYGGRITFFAGFDVQHLLPEGTPQQVRQGVRDLVRIFGRPEGGLMLAAGNGILPGTPLENIRAFLDEAARIHL